jgi:hypothetical protein
MTTSTLDKTTAPIDRHASRMWEMLKPILGKSPTHGMVQLASDALLGQLLVDRGAIDDRTLVEAANIRDMDGVLLEHVLHYRYGVELEDLLEAMSERRAIMAGLDAESEWRAVRAG